MKFLRFSVLMALIAGFGILSSCKKGDDPEPSIQEKNLGLMTDTWVVTSVTYEGQPSSVDYTGMTITISGTFNATSNTYNYTMGNRPVGKLTPWPASGTWSFDETLPQSIVIRNDDDLPMGYTVTDDLLQFDFTYTGDGYTGRTSVVEGDWVFVFEPN